MSIFVLLQQARRAAIGLAVAASAFAAGGSLAQTAPVALNTPATVTADVTPGSTGVDLVIPLAAVQRARIDVIVPVDGATVSLVDPNGLVVVPPGDSRVAYQPGSLLPRPLPGGVFELPELSAPVNGNWRLRVAYPPASVPTVVIGTVAAVSRYQVGLAIERTLFQVGEDVGIGLVVLDNGQPIAGLSPTITVTRVGGSGSTATARDNGQGGDGAAGDGVYSIDHTFLQAGTYQIDGVVGIPTASGTVQRSASAQVRVETPYFNPPSVTLQNVLGGGGCVNGLQVSVGLETLRPGAYSMLVRLVGPNGKSIDLRRALSLNHGASSTSVVFTSAAIKQQIAVDGPYVVDTIDILAVDGDEAGLAFRRRNAGSFAVPLASLCSLPIELPGPLTATPVLKNGMIGSLNLSFPVRVTVSGSYQISFKLIGAGGEDLGLINASRSLVAGMNTVTANVSTPAFLTSDGPYQAISLLVLGGGNSARQDLVGTTPAYSRWQFYPRVTGDLNADGAVDAADNALMTTFRGQRALTPGDRRDLNRDGLIDLRDARELQRLACTVATCPVNP